MFERIITLVVLSTSVVANYDRSITVFSPKGDLLQVEYAQKAVEQGSLVIAAANEEDSVVLCVGSGAAEELLGKEGGGSATTPSRLSILVDAEKNVERKLCKVDEGIYMAFAGLSADGRVLLTYLRTECQNYRLQYNTPPPLEHVAKYVSDIQHRFTLTGGARPFGVGCLLIGFDRSEGGKGNIRPRIHRCDPGGFLSEWSAVAIGRGGQGAIKALEKEAGALNDMGADDLARLSAEIMLGQEHSSGECDILVLHKDKKHGKVECRWLNAKKATNTDNDSIHIQKDSTGSRCDVILSEGRKKAPGSSSWHT